MYIRNHDVRLCCFAARAELIIVLGFADQRLVQLVGIVSERKRPPKLRLISQFISLGAETWQ